MPSFHIRTFGCRANQADSAGIRATLAALPMDESGDWRAADLIVVNSCTVTHRSDREVRQVVRRLHRGNPGARIVVLGCYAQRGDGIRIVHGLGKAKRLRAGVVMVGQAAAHPFDPHVVNAVLPEHRFRRHGAGDATLRMDFRIPAESA